MQAMILAAGLGTRLLPHTLIRPKPLFPILNKPLLLLTIARLQSLGFDHIVVNCHHLQEQIVEALSGISGVAVEREAEILGTGGGLRNALSLFRDEPLLITNGDIYHTLDFLDFYRYHAERDNGVTLAIHDFPRFNTVTVLDNNVVSFDNTVGERRAFTGLHVVDPQIIETIPDNRFSCIIDHYRRLLSEGKKIQSYDGDGCYWTDMGTSTDYLDLHKGLLNGTIYCWDEFGEVEKPNCITTGVKYLKNLELKGWASVGEALIGDNVVIERSVVWDDVNIPAGSHIVDTIMSASEKCSHMTGA